MAWKSSPSTSAAASGALSGAGMLPKICSILVLNVRATSPRPSGSPFLPARRNGIASQNQSQMAGSGSGSLVSLSRIVRASDLDIAIGMLLIHMSSVGSSGMRSLFLVLVCASFSARLTEARGTTAARCNGAPTCRPRSAGTSTVGHIIRLEGGDDRDERGPRVDVIHAESFEFRSATNRDCAPLCN